MQNTNPLPLPTAPLPAGDKTAVFKQRPEEVYAALGSSPAGLSGEEAQKRLAQYGPNQIAEKKGKPMWQRFLANFTSLMAILLWVSGVIAIIAQMPELGIAVWCVNLINGLFSFMQEYKASKVTEALKGMMASNARVLRDGNEVQVPTQDLVPGDVILVAEGDKIAADARVVVSADLQVNQSTLTGESNPVRKTADAIVRDDMGVVEVPNLIFTGSSVSSGSGTAVVHKTGMETEFGKISSLTQNVEEQLSPLQKELEHLTKQIAMIAMSFGVLFFVLSVFFVKEPVAKSFIFALGMVVAFIPEGLSPTVTLALAQGVQRMAKKNALVKNLSSVETLGCTSVICTDKTGTLTQNEMTVNHLWLPSRELEVTGTGYAPVGEIQQNGAKIVPDRDVAEILSAAALCSDAKILPPSGENPRYTVLGDPTEACLGVVAEKGGINVPALSETLPRMRELHFDSRRKRMTTIHQLERPVEGAGMVAFTKGAPKELIELCDTALIDGAVQPMTDELRARAMEANDQYARNGLRVLGVSRRYLDRKDPALPAKPSDYTDELIEQHMTFLGLVVMADPPRPEVAAAVKECHRAGIRVIMITGDYGLTAESIAKRIGIVEGEHPRVVSGHELAEMTDEQLKEALRGEVIFARVAPEQKYRVVDNLQQMGEIVAVTGDGVNDAPALKKANIGVAMGIAGTDVSKEAADMILTDDNFATIVHTVEQGRAVYTNIRRFLLYILNSNMPEAAPSAVFLLSKGAVPLPLTVMQILTIDLGTDLLPALGLGAEKPEAGSMDRPPRNLNEPLLTKNVFMKAFLWYGMIESVFAIIGYFLASRWVSGWSANPLAPEGSSNYWVATTMCLGAIIFSQIGMVMNCRTNKQSVFSVGLFSNRLINIGIVVEVLLFAALMYVPFLHNIFGTRPIPSQGWLFLLTIPFIVFGIEELRKAFLRSKDPAPAPAPLPAQPSATDTTEEGK